MVALANTSGHSEWIASEVITYTRYFCEIDLSAEQLGWLTNTSD